METRSSACPLDCPDLCGLTVTVDQGRVVEVNGDHRGPLTDGFICGKVRKIADHMYGEDRLTAPLWRSGPKGSGRWSPVSWDDALERIAGRIAEIRARAGGEAILPYSYGGSNGWLTEGALASRWFRPARRWRARCARRRPPRRTAGLWLGRAAAASPQSRRSNLDSVFRSSQGTA